MEKQETKVLGRTGLLKKEELQKQLVDLGKGESVYVRQMTGRERDQFEQSMLKKVNNKGVTEYEASMKDFRAKLAVNTCCDAKGKNIFEPTDYDQLSQNMSAARLERIVNVAQELNKISEKDKEDIVKN